MYCIERLLRAQLLRDALYNFKYNLNSLLNFDKFLKYTLHFGHSLVLAFSQLYVSESSAHFLSHIFSIWHTTGECHSSPHSKQNSKLHSHRIFVAGDESIPKATAFSQFGPGHHLISWVAWKAKNEKRNWNTQHFYFTCTKLLSTCFWKSCLVVAFVINCNTKASSSITRQLVSGQKRAQRRPSRI